MGSVLERAFIKTIKMAVWKSRDDVFGWDFVVGFISLMFLAYSIIIAPEGVGCGGINDPELLFPFHSRGNL